MKKLNSLLAVMATGSLSSAVSFGALQFYDGFDSYATNSDVVGQGYSIRNGSGSGTVLGTSLSYGSLATSPGSMSVATDGGYVNLKVDTGTGGGDYWISFLMTAPAAEYAAMRTGPGDGYPTIGNSPGNGYGTWGGGGTLVGAGEAFAPNTTIFIAAQVSGGTVTWYLNPTPGVASPGTAYETIAGGMAGEIEFGVVPATNGTVFDEIRVGDTYADVSPVPEPSTIGLVAVLGGAALFRRRRR